MLHIAVTGISAEAVEVVGRRLHGALLEYCESTAPGNAVWQSADSLVVMTAAAGPADVIEMTLRAGKHVLVVSRAGLVGDQLDRLESTAREQSVLLAIENPDHALPSRRLIRQQIDNAKLGDVGLIRVHRCEPAHPAGHQSGDAIPLALIGDLETVVWLVGRPPDTVYAVRRRIALESTPQGDCLQVHLGFPFGAMALLTLSTAWQSEESHCSLSVIASTGAAYADEHQNRQLLFGNGTVTAPLAEEGDATAALLQDFVVSTQNLDCSTDRLRAWRQLAKLTAAVEESLATQQAVQLECD